MFCTYETCVFFRLQTPAFIHNTVKMNMMSKFNFFIQLYKIIVFVRRPSSSGFTLVMLIVHNLDHMMQPHEWETLLTREIHGARVRYFSFVMSISLECVRAFRF